MPGIKINNGGAGSVKINQGGAGLPVNPSIPDPSPVIDVPVIYRITTSPDGGKIKLLFDRPMNNPAALYLSFSCLVNGISSSITSAGLIGSYLIELSLQTAAAVGDAILLTYTPGSVSSAAGGLLMRMVNAPVLNAVSGSDIPFFDNWDFIVDARQTGKFSLSGTNISRMFDAAGTGRFFDPVGGSAVLDVANNAIVITSGVTNEYDSQLILRKPASGRFTYVVKFKTPAAADASAGNAIYFLRSSSSGAVLISNYSPTAARRNMRIFTTADFYSASVAQNTISNDNSWHYIVATYDGSTYKMWADGTLLSKAVTISSSEMFNRIFQSNGTRATHAIRFEALGEYISDANVSTLNTYLGTL